MLGSEKVGKTNAEKLKELRELQLTNAKNGYYGEAAKAYQERKYERAINDPLQKSRSDIYLDRAMANAKEQSNNQVWDEETLRLNKLKNDRQKLLSYMTAEQKYKYNQTEQNARDSYVKAIRDELNQKLGLDYAEDILSEEDTGNRFAKTTALATASGLDMFKSGMKSAGNVIKDLATGKDEGTKTTRSANEYAFGAVRPDVGTGTGVVMDTMQSIGNMVPSIALGMATGGLGVPLSGAIGSAAMGIASGGNAYDEAVNEGASVKRAATYGALNGAKEVLLQQLIGALPGINKADSLARKVIGNMGDNVATKILGDSTLKNALVNVIGNALSEGTEEAAQELIETFLGNVVLGKDESYSLKDAAYSGLLGGITGGAFPAVGAAARGVSKANVNVNTNANSNINDVNNNVDTVNNSVNEVNNNTDTITNNQNVGNINDFNVNTENILEEESEPIKDSLKNTLRMVNRNAENNQQIYREIMTNNGYGDLVRRMDGIANRLGNEVQFYSSDTKEDGYNLDGKIYLNINNLKDSADAEWKVFKHELTHSLEGTKAYGKLLSSKEGAELFYDFLRNKGYVSTDEEGVTKLRPDVLREEIRERYARNGVNLTAEEVENEVAAKFIEESDILTDEKVIEKLAKGDRNFAQRVLDWIKDTLAKIGSDYETNRLRKAERMYEKAIRQAEKGQFEYEKTNEIQRSINPDFANEYDKWNGVDETVKFNVGTTSKALQSIGVDPKEIYWDSSKIIKTKKDHPNITDDVIKQVPNILEEPVLIMQSKKSDSRLTLYGEVYDKYNRPVLAVLELNPTGRNEYTLDYIKIASTYAKTGTERRTARENAQQLINDSKILYTDKERTDDWLRVNRLSLPLLVTNIGSNETISRNPGEVNTEMKINSVDSAKFSIPEDGELNRKEENALKRASNTLLNGFMEVTGAKGFEVDKKVFKDTINNFAKESVEAGRVDRTEADRLFNAMYNEAFTQELNVYDEYRPIMEQIKATKLYGGGLGSEEGTLRREYFNKIRLVTDPTATKIDSFYKELSDNHPELFDGDVTDIGDQVRALGDFVDKATAKQVKLTEIASNAQEVHNETKRAFDEKLNKFEKEIKNVKRSKETRGQAEALKESISDTAQKVMTDKEYRDSFYKEKAKNQREYNKIKSQETLSLKDMQALKALSDGIVTIDQLESRGDNFNVDGVKRIYDAYEKKNAYDKVQEFIKQESKSRYRALAEAMTQGSDGWEDKKAGRLYQRETMERNIEDITAKANGEKKGKKVKGNRKNEEAKKINDTYFKPVHQNEANSTRMKNEYTKRIKAMDLETVPKYTVSIANERTGMPQQVRTSESGLVQLYGEKLIDKETLSRVGADVEKVTNAVKEFREIYNELLDRANEVLVKNGYDEVEYRKDYFPHFTEDRADTVLKKIGAYFGIETTNELPTDIAGITDTFRPGKKWVGNFLAREGRTTDYDALKGFDRYINGVADVIWHTDDIQRLRAFETEIRYKYSDQGTKERINEIRANDVLTEEEKKNQISAILDAKDGRSHLSNFAQELRNYTDNLAGKKSRFDRDMEAKIGRSAYSIFKKLEGRVSANMVALNPGSWLTNFIPITQVSSITGIGSLLNATTDTIANTLKKNSDFAERSDFLTNRRGSEEVYERGGFLGKTDKAADILTKPFEVIDNFSAEVVTRALYYDAVKKGMTETEAMDYANDLAARVMADRSKGAQPTMFNETNPVTKLYTMFQTEVNNQYSFMFKDVPAEVGKEGKKALAGALFKMFIGAFLYNKLYEPLVGRKAAFDPVDIIATLIGDITDEDKDMWDVIYNTGNNVLDELPFVSSFTGGGRIPVSSALPDFANLGEAVFSDDISAKKRAETITKELANPILYLAPTIGGGQIKKAAEGIKTVAKGGEYTYDKEGNEKLKYAVEDPTVLKYIQATLFGKSSLKEAQDYYNSGSSILSVKQTQNYHKAVEAGINFEQYKAALNSVKGLESDKDSNGKTIALSLAKKKKAAVDEAVSGYNLTKKQKEVLYDACSISESVW